MTIKARHPLPTNGPNKERGRSARNDAIVGKGHVALNFIFAKIRTYRPLLRSQSPTYEISSKFWIFEITSTNLLPSKNNQARSETGLERMTYLPRALSAADPPEYPLSGPEGGFGGGGRFLATSAVMPFL